MNEKVKLPKFVCDWLDQHKEELCDYPMVSGFSKLARKRDIVGDVRIWLFSDTTNQWLLIDALRYGYEAETEPRWGIKAGNCYMTNPDNYGFDDVTPETAIENDAYWAIKSYADDIVKTLGFGEVVDLNKEVEG